MARRLFPRGGDRERSRSPALEPGRPRASRASKAANIFREEPAPLEEFVTEHRFLGNPRLSPVQFEALRHLEQIYLRSTYPIMVREFGPQWAPVRFVNSLVLQWAKGSGKDFVCQLGAARVAYLLLCLRNPLGYFGLARQSSIHLLNVAAAEAQAREVFFKPLRRLISSSPCFAGRFEMKAGSIAFDNGVQVISGHSGAETQEGLNLLLGIADEISAFRTDEEVAHLVKPSGREPTGTARGILRMMTTSGRTRFPESFKIVAISYPRFKGDAIQALTTEAREDNRQKGERSRWYVSGPLPTWKVNPNVPSKDVFREDYERDPAMARAMYECDPDLNLNRVFPNEAAVRAAFSAKVPEPLVIDYVRGPATDQAASGQPGPPMWRAHFSFPEGFRPVNGARYVIHGDIAIRRNRAGIAMVHVKEWHPSPDDDDEGAGGLLAYVAVDFVASFEAELDADPPREIQIAWYRDLVRSIRARGFDIARVTFDGYQSTDTRQILHSWGIESIEVSTDRTPRVWETLADVISDGRLIGYDRRRVVKELLGLIRLPNGKVRVGSGGSKDEVDAVGCAVFGAIEVGGAEQPEGEDTNETDWFTVAPGRLADCLPENPSGSWSDLGPGRHFGEGPT